MSIMDATHQVWLVGSTLYGVKVIYRWIMKGASKMGVQLSDLALGEARGEFVWGTNIVHFAYDPNAYTAEAESEWQVITRSGWAGEMVISFIQRMVLSWDLLGDVAWDMRAPTEEELEDDPDAQPQPIPGTGRIVESDTPFPLDNRVKMRFIPMMIFGEITAIIQDGMQVGKAKRPRSAGGSGTAGVTPIRR